MRRRAVFAALSFVTLASCYYGRPVFIPERSGGGRGSLATPCREINRIKCAVEECRGANMDHVTYQCAGERAVSRCVANFGCSAD